jgi:hypothetical protein
MIVVPYLSLVVGAALIAISIGFIYPPLAGIFFATSEGAVLLLVKIVSLLLYIPGSYFYLPSISVIFLIHYYLLLTAAALLLSAYLKKRSKNKPKN